MKWSFSFHFNFIWTQYHYHFIDFNICSTMHKYLALEKMFTKVGISNESGTLMLCYLLCANISLPKPINEIVKSKNLNENTERHKHKHKHTQSIQDNNNNYKYNDIATQQQNTEWFPNGGNKPNRKSNTITKRGKKNI